MPEPIVGMPPLSDYIANVNLPYNTDVITVLFYVLVKIVCGSGAAAPRAMAKRCAA